MLPKKLHYQVIDRFHNRIDKIDKDLDAIRDEYGDDPSQYPQDIRDKSYKLANEYYHMTKIWYQIDNFLEYGVGHKMDILKHEPQESWYRELKDDE